jgi:hypothetical protein
MDLSQRGQNNAPEFRQVGVGALAVKLAAAVLILPKLDRQRRLADVAGRGREGEVEMPGNRKKIADLLHFLAGIHLVANSRLP